MSLTINEFVSFENSVLKYLFFKIDLNSKEDKLKLINYLQNTFTKYVKAEYCFIDNKKTNISELSLDKLENYESLIIDRDTCSDVWFGGERCKDVKNLVSIYIEKRSQDQPDNSITVIFNGNLYSYDNLYCTDEDVSKNLATMRKLLTPLFDNFEFILSSNNKELHVFGKLDFLEKLDKGYGLGTYTKDVADRYINNIQDFIDKKFQVVSLYFKIDLNSKEDKLKLINYLQNTFTKYVKAEYCFIDNKKTNISELSLDKLENYESLIIDRDTCSDVWFGGERCKDVKNLVTLYLSDNCVGNPDNSFNLIFSGNLYSYDNLYCTDEDVSKNLATMRKLLTPLFDNFEFILSSKEGDPIIGKKYTLRFIEEGFGLGAYTRG